MSKKDLIINISPFIAFFFGLPGAIIGAVLLLGISIYNTVTSSNCSDILVSNIFSTFSSVLGIVLSCLIGERVHYDPEMGPVMWLFVGLAVAYMGILTLSCCIVKRVVKKKD